MVLPGSAGGSGAGGLHSHRRRSGTAALELAAAAALRLARAYLLASAWDAGAVPDSLRRVWQAQVTPPQGRALGGHDPRGAGTIPARHPLALRLRPIHQR